MKNNLGVYIIHLLFIYIKTKITMIVELPAEAMYVIIILDKQAQ